MLTTAMPLPVFDKPSCKCPECLKKMANAVELWFTTVQEQHQMETAYCLDALYWNGEFTVDAGVQVRESEPDEEDGYIIVTYLEVIEIGIDHPYEYVCLNSPDSELPTFPVPGTDGYEYEMFQRKTWGSGVARIWR